MNKQKDRTTEINQSEGEREKNIKKNEKSLRYLWDIIKHTNISIMQSQGEKEKKWAERIFEKIMERKLPKFKRHEFI